MPRNVHLVNILIASPGDVPKEREVVLRIFNKWNAANAASDIALNAVMWESSGVPGMGAPPQKLLNERLLAHSDLLVGIFWSRLGTPTNTARSGTVEEIREFIGLKGPRRVMLYFCTRALPYDIDTAELSRVTQFKAEMREQGLYSEYDSVERFESDLYRHLDVKVEQLVAGKLDIDADSTSGHSSQGNIDPRLRTRLDFGTTLEEIAVGFAGQMDAFDRMPDKFLALGAHVYDCVAANLDRYMKVGRPAFLTTRKLVESVSADLKSLAASRAQYIKLPFPQYWAEGRALSNQLTEHVDYLKRTMGAR